MIISVSLFFLFIKPRIGLICGLSVAVISLLIDSFTGFPLIERFIHHWDGTGRIPLWISAWKMFLDAPLLGHGPHTFVQLYQGYLQNVRLPSWLFVDSRNVPWPHNLYLEVLAEQGIFGFLAFLFLLIKGLFAALNVRTLALHEVRILGYGILASLSGFCFASFIELTFLRQWVTLVLFTNLGVIAHLSSKISKEEASYG
jgi:O-antigen ligase